MEKIGLGKNRKENDSFLSWDITTANQIIALQSFFPLDLMVMARTGDTGYVSEIQPG